MSFADRFLALVNDNALFGAESLRAALLADAEGDVVEIGFGSGLNARHYGDQVERVTAIEPGDVMWRRGAQRADDAGLRVERVAAFAESLPLDDASVDCAVSTFVLCSVRDPQAVLSELARVVRPGGTLLLLEHTEHPGPLTRRAQAAITPLWRRALGGCHPGRDLVTPLRHSAWREDDERFVDVPWMPRVVRHHVMGRYRVG